MAISFGSINTGLPKDIVQQIVAAEKIPIQNMETRKGKVEQKRQLLQELIKRVKELRDALDKIANDNLLRELKVDTNNDLIGVTVDKGVALPGNYTFEVRELAQKSSALTNGVRDKDESYLGVGYISYYTPDGEEEEIYIDQENSSLTKIAELINKQEDSGMYATVVNDGTGASRPWHLIISLKETGDLKAAEFPYFYMVDADEDLFIEQERQAHDAVVKLDGFEVEVPQNKIKDLIPGVNIDLKKAKPGEEFSIKIGDDKEAVSAKLDDIVKRINDVLQFINEQNAIDQNTDTSKTLGGDLTLQTLESRLRSVIFRPVNTAKGKYRFGDLGVTFQKNGLLEFDRGRFEKMVADDYALAAEILVGSFNNGVVVNGFIGNLRRAANDALKFPSGILTTRDNGLKSQIGQIDKQIETRLSMIERKEKLLKQKFARLETTMAELKNAGAGLASLGANAQNVVQQLG